MKQIYTIFLLVLATCSYSQNIKQWYEAEVEKAGTIQPTEIKFEKVIHSENQEIETVKISDPEVPFGEFVTMELPMNGQIEKLLLKEVQITTYDYQAKTSSGMVIENSNSKHYQGIIDGKNGYVAISKINEKWMGSVVFEDFIMSLSPNRNNNEEYLIKRDNSLDEFNISCGSFGDNYQSEGSQSPTFNQTNVNQINEVPLEIYWEVDYDMYIKLGEDLGLGDDADGYYERVDYLKAMFHQVASLYANDGIDIKLSDILIWLVDDGYDDNLYDNNDNGVADILDSFQGRWNDLGNNFSGDFAQLVSHKNLSNSSGYGQGLINNYNLGGCLKNSAYSFVALRDTEYFAASQYSFNIYLIAHELGHNLGSNHTHDCSWTVDNIPLQAIDGCKSSVGICSDGPIPPNGGTIMSYCSENYGDNLPGISFYEGFHPIVVSRFNSRIQAFIDADCPRGLTDDDNDGVPKYLDHCPDTPEGETVNENGCSASQIPLNVELSTQIQLENSSLVRYQSQEGIISISNSGEDNTLYQLILTIQKPAEGFSFLIDPNKTHSSLYGGVYLDNQDWTFEENGETIQAFLKSGLFIESGQSSEIGFTIAGSGEPGTTSAIQCTVNGDTGNDNRNDNNFSQQSVSINLETLVDTDGDGIPDAYPDNDSLDNYEYAGVVFSASYYPYDGGGSLTSQPTFSNNGHHFYYIYKNDIHHYALENVYDFNNISSSPDEIFEPFDQNGNVLNYPRDISINSDGSSLYVLVTTYGTNHKFIYQYDLSDAYNLSSASYVDKLQIPNSHSKMELSTNDEVLYRLQPQTDPAPSIGGFLFINNGLISSVQQSAEYTASSFPWITGFSVSKSGKSFVTTYGSPSIDVSEQRRYPVSEVWKLSTRDGPSSSNFESTLPNVSESMRIDFYDDITGVLFLTSVIGSNPAIFKLHKFVRNSSATTDTNTDRVIDIDGNVYETVKIGNQTWMASNLKTTRYADGTPIPLLENNTDWANLDPESADKAYCWYNNDSNNKEKYGALYNYAAVSNGDFSDGKVQGACPFGWHIPTTDEYNELLLHLQEEYGNDHTGGSLKEAGTENWLPPNTNATNATSFTGLPAGIRQESDGSFTYLGERIMIFRNGGGHFMLRSDSGTIGGNSTPTQNNDGGMSCRCIKD